MVVCRVVNILAKSSSFLPTAHAGNYITICLLIVCMCTYVCMCVCMYVCVSVCVS